MKYAFWVAVGAIAYTYLGYPCALWLRAQWRSRPVKRAPHTPPVSIVMVVRNEERYLKGKLRNLLGLDYPADRLQVVVVSDGSTAPTEAILRQFADDPRLHFALNQLPRGKACCLNDALDLATGELVVFTDARQKLEPRAVALLAENFADPAVGCASGELMLGDAEGRESSEKNGLYWKIEKRVRELESASASVVGATGALFAARRSLVSALPAGILLDDVYVPMNIVRQGKRVIFDGRARAWDVPYLGPQREFRRKVRTLTGNYQLVEIAPWLLTPKNPLLVEFVSHKLLRLLMPFALLLALVTAAWVHAPLYRLALIGQVGLYALGLHGLVSASKGPLARVTGAAFTFVMLNVAAAVAFAHFVTRRKVAWS